MLGERFAKDGKSILSLREMQQEAKREYLEDLEKENSPYTMESYLCECGAGEEDFEVLAEKDRYGLPVRTVICKRCGLIMTNPRMTQESYNYFYANTFAKLYRGDAGTEGIGARFEIQRKRGKRVCEFVQKYSDRTIQTVLEIGCAAGGILSVFQEQGCEVAGVDLDDAYLEYGRSKGLDLRLGHSSDLLQEEKKYDLIILSHVFEHFLDIEKELSVIQELLAPDGLLYIEVPGLKVLEHGGYGGDFLASLQNAHVRIFSLGTLSNVMKKYGFDFYVGSEMIQSLFCYSGNRVPLMKNCYDDNMDLLMNVEVNYLRKVLARYKELQNNSN